MWLKKLRIRTKVCLIIIVSLLIVETVFLFPSLNKRRQTVIDEQIEKIALLTDVLSNFPDNEFLNSKSEELKKHHIIKLTLNEAAEIRTSIIDNVLTYQGKGFEIEMDVSWVEKDVRQYAINIIGITLVIIVSVTLVAFIFLTRNKTIRRAELAEERAVELESENVKQNKVLQEIIDASTGMATNLVSSTDELKLTSSNLSESVTSQAASIEEISASLEEVFVSTEQIANKAADQVQAMKFADDMMLTLSKTTSVTTDQANTAMERIIETRNTADAGEKYITNALASMKAIKETTGQVSQILSAIEDISDRVNLLSLNAAIEAARAGEMGRGFAIVADEIGKLADQTAQSTKEITQLVKLENERVVAGTQIVETLAQSFIQIDQNIKQVDNALRVMVDAAFKTDTDSKEMKKTIDNIQKMADDIFTSTTEQNITGKSMTNSIEEINTRVQAIALTSRELTSFIDSVVEKAENMLRLVKKG
jgi:methyl-accepting chemotaxis protein